MQPDDVNIKDRGGETLGLKLGRLGLAMTLTRIPFPVDLGLLQ